MEKIEYRVRPVTRFVVTRYQSGENCTCGVSTLGEYDNVDTAYAVGYALCRAEHERLGWPLDDTRITYPCPASPGITGVLERHVIEVETGGE